MSMTYTVEFSLENVEYTKRRVKSFMLCFVSRAFEQFYHRSLLLVCARYNLNLHPVAG